MYTQELEVVWRFCLYYSEWFDVVKTLSFQDDQDPSVMT